MDLYLGIDVSTTATKAILDQSRAKWWRCARANIRLKPRTRCGASRTRHWWKGATESIRRSSKRPGEQPDTVIGVGLTGQMHGLVLLDRQGRCCGPPSCGTTSVPAPSATRSVAGSVGGSSACEITGNLVPCPASPRRRSCGCASTSRTCIGESADSSSQGLRPIPLDGRVRHRLSDASGTSLLDVARGRWSSGCWTPWRSRPPGCRRATSPPRCRDA